MKDNQERIVEALESAKCYYIWRWINYLHALKELTDADKAAMLPLPYYDDDIEEEKKPTTSKTAKSMINIDRDITDENKDLLKNEVMIYHRRFLVKNKI